MSRYFVFENIHPEDFSILMEYLEANYPFVQAPLMLTLQGSMLTLILKSETTINKSDLKADIFSNVSTNVNIE